MLRFPDQEALLKHFSGSDHPVIYMSGYSTERDLGPISEEHVTILQKPFSPRLLQARIRKLLDHELAESGTEHEGG